MKDFPVVRVAVPGLEAGTEVHLELVA
jgi:hypothetical protein